MLMHETALITVSEAADQLRCSRLTVYRAIGDGRLDAVRLGSKRARLRIPTDALDRFLRPAGGRADTREDGEA